MGAVYLDRDTLELIFGKANIKRWADLDGDGDEAKITDRIKYAIQSASDFIETILRGKNYDLVDVDDSIKRLIAQIAALNLYDAREIIDGDPTSDKLSIVRQQVDEYIGKIRRGEITLKGKRTTSTPKVVPYDDEFKDSILAQRPFFCTQTNPFYGRFHP